MKNQQVSSSSTGFTGKGNSQPHRFQRLLPWLAWGIFTLCFIGIYAYTLDPKLDLNGDNASYIKLAHTLAEGHGYSNVDLEGNYVPASHFPPGYPFLLSVFIRLGMDSLIGFKILNGVFLFLAVSILYFITLKTTRQTCLAFSIAMLSLLSPSLMHFAGIAMSEISYLLATVLSLASLFLYDRQARGKSTNGTDGSPFRFYQSPYFYTAFLFAAASYYIRTIGVSCLFAVWVFFLFRKEWKASLASLGGMVLCLLPWMIRNAVHGIKGRYLGTVMTVNPWRPEEGSISSVGEMIDKMLTNIDDTVIQGFKTLLFPFIDSPGNGFGSILGGLVIVALVIWGIWNTDKLRWAFLGFLLANIGVFALWHGGNGTRYVVPLIPFLFVFFYTGVFYGIRLFFRKKPLKDNRLWPLVSLLMAIPMVRPVQELRQSNQQPYPMAYTNYFALAQAVEKDFPGSIVCCRKPELFGYYSPSSRGTNYRYTLEADSLIADLVKKNVEFVVLDQLGYSSTARYLYPAIQKNPDLFQAVYFMKAPDTYLFRFNREAATQKSGRNPMNLHPAG